MRRYLAFTMLLAVVGLSSLGTFAASAVMAPPAAAVSCYPTCPATPGAHTGSSGAGSLSEQTPTAPVTTPSDGTATPAVASKASGPLAFTGADIAGTVVIAAVILLAGVVLVRVSRRRARV